MELLQMSQGQPEEMTMDIKIVRSDNPKQKARDLGAKVLGPVVDRWMLALHQFISYLDDGETEFLFCARAGIRIKKLYDAHVGITAGSETKGAIFWSSRVAACKGVFRRFSSGATEILTKEYLQSSLAEMVSGLLRNHPDLQGVIDYTAAPFQTKGESFREWLQTGTTDARIMTNYLDQCGVGFDRYLRGLIGKKKKVVLIDSGWQGTVQWLLSNAYPEIEWKGLYFGRIISEARPASFVDHVIGLMFEADQYTPSDPITAVVHFHHLIEKLLEAGGPSIEEVPEGQYKAAAKKQIAANLKAESGESYDALFAGVLEYIEMRARSAATVSDIMRSYEEVLPELERLILFPTRHEALALGSGERSADFGKSLKVPVLRRPSLFEEEGEEERIERSLWRPGQIALEYEEAEAEQRQGKFVGYSRALLDPNERNTGHHRDQGRHVAIITRTKDRPVLLRRAAASVASQTHRDYTWVVINDGGDIERVKSIIDNCPVERQKITLINNRVSHGMEAASNLAIRNSASEFVVIHDDDDSWSPNFLEETTKFLSCGKGRPYDGVITRTIYVSEEIRGTKVIEHSRVPYHDWVRNVQLTEMAKENFFAPIAFVFRRSMYDEVGGYNEKLPVLGDWFFNMEFLLKADIGVIQSTTAFYHHRDVGVSGGAYSNSVIGDISKHEQYASIARNMFLRKHNSNLAAISVISGYFAKSRDVAQQPGGGSSRKAVDWSAEEGLDVDAIEAEFDRQWLINQLNSGYVFSIADDLKKYKQAMAGPETRLDVLVSTIMEREINITPPPIFDEDAYLSRYPDVAEVVRSGGMPNGYYHYICYGKAEGRRRYRRT
jgi:glycosyltransferase involved in cell wall biosynthesis